MRESGGHGSDRRPPAPGPNRSGRPGPSGTNGHVHHPGPGRPYDAFTADLADDDTPIDLVELQADDELINALSSGLGVSGPGQRGYDANDRLVAMLASWRADVDAEPMPQLVEPDVAAAALTPQHRSRRVSFLRPVIAAVAVAACGLGVLSVTAHEAQPGDSLWALSKVLYTERAEQVQAAADLRTGIDRVNTKLASGDTAGAQQDLAAMAPLLAKVEPGQLDYFAQQRQFLNAKAAETPAGQPTDPGAPLRNGTQAPPPPPGTEGSGDQGPGTVTSPQAPSGTAPGPTGPSGPSGSTGPGNDPRSLRAPESSPGPGPVSPTPESPSKPADPTPPTTEGSADPTTTTTRPTASGEGGEDPPSSTSTGAVSSTPR